jgi:DNA uptake protein ComE-like DNA-binding protein
MNRPTVAALLGSAALLVVLAGCQDSAQEAPEAGTASAEGAAGTSVPAPAAPAPAGMAGSSAPTGTAAGAFLDPNAASAEELATVPGVDPQLAQALVAGRPYADMRAVDRVLAGRLGEPQRDSVYTRLWKPLDLNSASKEEILLIPGVGERMHHEFEEYRPYRSIEQFRREIGKYVDDEEVARLERYVTIR